MSEEEKIKISVNEEDMQNLINCYKKDIEYIMQLEKENKELQQRINIAIEYIENNATSNYFDKEKNMFRREEDLLEILKEVE